MMAISVCSKTFVLAAKLQYDLCGSYLQSVQSSPTTQSMRLTLNTPIHLQQLIQPGVCLNQQKPRLRSLHFLALSPNTTERAAAASLAFKAVAAASSPVSRLC